jgi:hypothetical protein
MAFQGITEPRGKLNQFIEIDGAKIVGGRKVFGSVRFKSGGLRVANGYRVWLQRYAVAV